MATFNGNIFSRNGNIFAFNGNICSLNEKIFPLLKRKDQSLKRKDISIQGKKSITIPHGVVKIKRPVKSLDIIIRTCASVKMLSQSKERLFEKEKFENVTGSNSSAEAKIAGITPA